MGQIDLSNATDFARATMQDLGKLGLGGGALADPSQWDVYEAGYISDQTLNGRAATLLQTETDYVLFHVFVSKKNYQAGLQQVQDTGGRRVARYKFPFRDGQTTDDIGRAPEDFSIDCMIHGNNYINAFVDILNELNKPTPGTLRHPVRGLTRVKFVDYRMVHTHDTRKAIVFTLNFTEHNYSISDITKRSGVIGFKDKLGTSTGAFAKINAVLDKIDSFSTRAKQLLGTAKSLLNKLTSNLNLTFTGLAITFLPDSSGTQDIPGIMPVNQGGSSNGSFPVGTSPSDPFVAVPITQSTQAAVAADQLTKDIIARRQDISAVIEELTNYNDGEGGIIFHDDILSLRQIAIDIQQTLELGLQSSKSLVTNYTTPRDMSLREVTFAVGLPVDRVIDIDLLNPQLESTNFIAKGTSVKVVTS